MNAHKINKIVAQFNIFQKFNFKIMKLWNEIHIMTLVYSLSTHFIKTCVSF